MKLRRSLRVKDKLKKTHKMSFTESNYGERFWALERSMMAQMDKENAQRQYKEMCDAGDNEHDQTFEQWFEAGNYDPHDWGVDEPTVDNERI